MPGSTHRICWYLSQCFLDLPLRVLVLVCVLVSNKYTRIVDHVRDHRAVDVPLPHLRGQEQAAVHNFKNLFLSNRHFSFLLQIPDIVAGNKVGQGSCIGRQPKLSSELAEVLLYRACMLLILSQITTCFMRRPMPSREWSISIWGGSDSIKLKKFVLILKKEPLLDTISMFLGQRYQYLEEKFIFVWVKE